MPDQAHRRRQWRFYETPAGNRPVRDYIASLPEADHLEIVAAMKDVAEEGLAAAKHLQGHGDLYEVIVDGEDNDYRLLFCPEGRYNQVLLALHAFPKRSRQTPTQEIETAVRRRSMWRQESRG